MGICSKFDRPFPPPAGFCASICVIPLALPAAAWALGAPKPLLWLASAAAAMVIVRHVSNIVCLVRGVPLSVRKPAPAPGLEKTSETQ